MSFSLNLKRLAAAMGMACVASLPLTAGAVLIDGIEVGTSGNFHFVATTAMGGPIPTTPGGLLEGVGKVTGITDGAGGNVWTDGQNGKELTFTFFYTASSFASNHVAFSGGHISVFSDSSPDANFATGAGFDDGNLWLDLTPTLLFDPITGTNAAFTGNITSLGSSFSITGTGLASVTGAGLADSFFNTNSQNGADFEINDSVNNTPSGGAFAMPNHGTTNLSQNAVVPEPATLTLIGVGLLGICGRIRRRKNGSSANPKGD